MMEKEIVEEVTLDNGVSMICRKWGEEKRDASLFGIKRSYFVYYNEIVYGNSIVLSSYQQSGYIPETVMSKIFKGYLKVFKRFDPSIVNQYLSNNKIYFDSGAEHLETLYENNWVDKPQLNNDELLAYFLTMNGKQGRWSYFGAVFEETFHQLSVEHVKYWENRDVSGFVDLEKIMNPVLFQHGDKEYDFMKRVGKKLYYANKLESPYFRNIVRYLLSFSSKINPSNVSLPLKEITIVPDSSLVLNNNVGMSAVERLPLKTKTYCDYLLELPLSKIDLILKSDYSFIKSGASAKGAIAVTEKFFEDTEQEIDSTSLAHEVYCAAFSRLDMSDRNKSNSYEYPLLLTQIYEAQNRITSLQALKLHFESGTSKISWNEIQNYFNVVLLPTEVRKWLTSSSNVESIINILLPVVGELTVEALMCASEGPEPLPATKWINLTENFDSFKELPVSWWRPMM